MVQIAVLKISRRFQFSTETVENVQWGWNRNFVRCLRNRTYGSRVSSYDNRSTHILFKFFLNHSSTLFVFLSKWIQAWPSLKVKHWVSRSGIPARKIHLQVYTFIAFSSYFTMMNMKWTAIFESLFYFIFAKVSGRKHFTSQHLTSLFLAIVTFLQSVL